MKNKKILFLLIFVLIIILISLFIIVKNFNKKDTNTDATSYSEYTPEEEISSEQLRETIVSLYFVDSENNLKAEGRLIDSADLLQNTYDYLVNLLIAGPETTTLNKVFPENTTLFGSKLEGTCVVLNFSEEIQNYTDDTQKYNIINSLLNALTQLNEVNSIKIIINNESSDKFDTEYFLHNE